jgi:peptidoglycan/LPS O-acetylase OafA/YrhL
MKEKIFFNNLDGLRFLAFFGVFIAHFIQRYPEHTQNYFLLSISHTGEMGVNFFFCLSSFLITYLLLKEKEKNKSISIGSFYIRRFLRIWPLYFLIVFLGFVILPLLSHFLLGIVKERAGLPYFLCFFFNFEPIIKHAWEYGNIGFLWSIAIEEQFYFLWPVILAIFSVKKQYWIFIFILILSVTFRWFNSHDLIVLTYHTLSVFSDMGMGALLAWLCIYKPTYLMKFDKKIIIYGVYILSIVLFFVRPMIFNSPIALTFERLAYSLVFIFFILEQNYFSNSFYKIGRFKYISELGKYTYGLYMIHMFYIAFIFILFNNYIAPYTGIFYSLAFIFLMSIGLVLTIVSAIICYNVFENRFLKLKDKFAVFVKN